MQTTESGQGGVIVAVDDDVSVEYRRRTRRPKPRAAMAASAALRFLPLFAVWLILSGMLDPFHMGLGVVSCLAVALFSQRLTPPRTDAPFPFRLVFRLPLYGAWLMWEIVKANFWVLYLVFHPRMMEKIDPRLITFKSRLTSRAALTVFANSITLTPGTITVSVNERGDFLVHAIDGKSADGLPGDMERKIAETFGE
jgi:multicomponent Na+:H+ antiporter subunit E